MKIKKIELNNFKRFTHLSVEDIPETTKLVILVGPNGSGKTSFMEAMNHYYKCAGYNDAGDYHYLSKAGNVEEFNYSEWRSRALKLVNIDFHEATFSNTLGNHDDITKTLLEYGDYATQPTKFNASQFLTLAMEENWSKVQEIDGYAKYIATRPRAERLGEHGLFGDEDVVDLNAAMAEVNSYTGNIWTHIISLRREDAERLGFDHADAWRALLRAHRNDIAEAMHIPPEDFRWYAAFHDEGGHPHVHMMAWSKKPGQAYLNRDGIRKIKSVLTNQIFQQELLHIYEDKSQSRDELVRETRSAMQALAQKMQNSACEHPEAEQMIRELTLELGSVKGKKSSGYLPKDLKRKVDAIVDQMELLQSVYECYERWWKLQCRLNDFYAEKERQRPPLSQQKEFRQIKNAVIQVAEQVQQNKITFEDVGAEQDAEQNATCNVPYPANAWHAMATDESMSLEERDEAAKQLEALADGGDRYAQYLTGILYRDGGLLIPDAAKAQHYLELAARQDHAAAQ